MNIKQIVFTNSDLNNNLKNNELKNAAAIEAISPDLLDFIKKVKLIDDGYIIYVEFTDKTYALLKVF